MERDRVQEILDEATGGLKPELCADLLVNIIGKLCDVIEECGRDVKIVLRNISMEATRE